MFRSQFSQQATVPTAPQEQARFLSSHNPALVKRNVLASFTNVLLMPVTIVPRTTVAVGKAFGTALTTGGTAAVQGLAMLNPQRWGAASTQWATNSQNNAREGYMDFNKGGGGGGDAMLFDVGVDEEDEDEDGGAVKEKQSNGDAKRGVRCQWARSSALSAVIDLSQRQSRPQPRQRRQVL